MKTKMRPRYYCDHCGKGSGSPSAMRRHELHCISNPNRICGFCSRIGNETVPITELVKALGKGDAAGICAVQIMCDECPACTLAAIKASGLQRNSADEEGLQFHVAFDYKKAKEDWWSTENDARRDGACL